MEANVTRELGGRWLQEAVHIPSQANQVLFHSAPQTKGTVSDTNIHHGLEERLPHHRKVKLESFKSQKLLLLLKASRVRGGLPSTWIHADS